MLIAGPPKAVVDGTDVDAGLPPPRRGVAVASVLMAMAMVVLDAGMASVALPSISRALHIGPAQSVVVVTAYQAALVMTLLPAAALGERLGYRRMFAGGVGVFTAASTLSMLAPSLPWLAAARFAQGLGSAAVMALGVALLRATVPNNMLGTAIGWNALTVALVAAASPAVGAVVLAAGGWRWLYAVNLPIGIAVLIAARTLPPAGGNGPRIDLRSIAGNALGFASLVLGAELLPTAPAVSAALFLIAGRALTWLIARERPKAAPLIPLDLLRRRAFRLSVLASICCFTGQAAGMIALPFYLQQGLGLSPLRAGLYLTPWPLSVAAAATVTGRLADRYSTAWLCAVGGTLLALGLSAAAAWPLQGDPRPCIPLAILCGLGFGLFQVPNNRNLLVSAPRNRAGAAGGMQGAARLTGQTAGALIMTLLFSTTSQHAAPRIGLAVGAAFALAAGLISTSRLRAD